MQSHEQLTSYSQDTVCNSNIIVLGVGHSGTTVLTRMLFALGWNAGIEGLTADEEFAEHVGVRRCNRFAMEHGHLPPGSLSMLAEMRIPWAIKDPRMAMTLHYWAAEFEAAHAPLPVLLLIVRELEAVRASYLRRGEFVRGGVGSHGHTIEGLHELAEQQFAAWRGPKLRIEYERLVAAVQLFDPQRAKPRSQTAGHRHELISMLTSAQQEICDLRDLKLQQIGRIHALQERLNRYAADAQDKNAMITALKRMADEQRAAQRANVGAISNLREEIATAQAEIDRLHTIRSVERCVAEFVPPDKTVLVVSEGDDDLVNFLGPTGWHFPRSAEGWHSRSHPADSAQAVSDLQKWQSAGASFLLVPSSSFWWFDYYAAWAAHLAGHHREIFGAQDCRLFRLSD